MHVLSVIASLHLQGLNRFILAVGPLVLEYAYAVMRKRVIASLYLQGRSGFILAVGPLVLEYAYAVMRKRLHVMTCG